MAIPNLVIAWRGRCCRRRRRNDPRRICGLGENEEVCPGCADSANRDGDPAQVERLPDLTYRCPL